MTSRVRFVRSFGLQIETIAATPDWARRPVSMVNPSERQGFLDDVTTAVEIARRHEVSRLILTSGNEIPQVSREQQFTSLVEGCKRACDLASAAGVMLIIEPLNAKADHRGYFLTTCAEGVRLVKRVNHPHLRILLDLYHEDVQTGTAIRTAIDAMPDVAVYHVADNPGRHEPGSGQMNFSELYKALGTSRYSGVICMEYLPVTDPEVSLIRSLEGMRTSLHQASG